VAVPFLKMSAVVVHWSLVCAVVVATCLTLVGVVITQMGSSYGVLVVLAELHEYVLRDSDSSCNAAV